MISSFIDNSKLQTLGVFMDKKIIFSLLLTNGFAAYGMDIYHDHTKILINTYKTSSHHENTKKLFITLTEQAEQKKEYELGKKAVTKIIKNNSPSSAKTSVGSSKLFVINQQSKL